MLINQVSLGKRYCPSEITAEIIKAARAALEEINQAEEEQYNIVEVERRLRGALDGKESDDGDLVLKIYHRQLLSKNVIISNPFPLEERSGHPEAHRFHEAMVDALLGESGTNDQKANYSFILDERRVEVARALWSSLFLFLRDTKRMSDEEADSALKKLDTEPPRHQEWRFSIYMVPQHLCILPFVVFDPKERDRAEAYIWDWYLKDGEVVNNIAKLTQRTCEKWIEDFYFGFIKSTKIRRFRYIDD